VDDDTKKLEGSPSRDRFKLNHKLLLGKDNWGHDLDFVLVDKYPCYRIVAFLDYKKPRDGVSFSEAIGYNILRQVAPLFIVYGENVESGPFSVYRFESADPKPNPPRVTKTMICKCESWEALGVWEEELRHNHRLITRAPE